MMVASIRRPTPRPVARILMAVAGALDMARNANPRIKAALVTSRPEAPVAARVVAPQPEADSIR